MKTTSLAAMLISMTALTLASVAGVVTVSAPTAQAQEAGTLAQETGTIKGRVTFKGGRERLKPQHVPKVINPRIDPNCTKRIGTWQARVQGAWDGAGLQGVRVAIRDGLDKDKTYAPPPDQALLEFKDCEYQPHVFGMMAGQELLVRSHDWTMHNFQALSRKNPNFQHALVPGQPEAKRRLDKPERFFIKCNVHPWEGSYCEVFNHPFFAVTDKEGRYEITNVPPGEYTLEFWHETFGSHYVGIRVKVGATSSIPHEYSYDPMLADGELPKQGPTRNHDHDRDGKAVGRVPPAVTPEGARRRVKPALPNWNAIGGG